MICELCNGKGLVQRHTGQPEPCLQCGGYAIRHCCDGDQWSDHERAIEQGEQDGQEEAPEAGSG